MTLYRLPASSRRCCLLVDKVPELSWFLLLTLTTTTTTATTGAQGEDCSRSKKSKNIVSPSRVVFVVVVLLSLISSAIDSEKPWPADCYERASSFEFEFGLLARWELRLCRPPVGIDSKSESAALEIIAKVCLLDWLLTAAWKGSWRNLIVFRLLVFAAIVRLGLRAGSRESWLEDLPPPPGTGSLARRTGKED